MDDARKKNIPSDFLTIIDLQLDENYETNEEEATSSVYLDNFDQD